MCASKNYKPVKGSQGKLIGYEKPDKNKDDTSRVYHGEREDKGWYADI